MGSVLSKHQSNGYIFIGLDLASNDPLLDPAIGAIGGLPNVLIPSRIQSYLPVRKETLLCSFVGSSRTF